MKAFQTFTLHSCFLPYHPCQSPHPVRKVRHIVGVPWVRPVNAAVLTAGRIRPTSMIACTLASRPMEPAPIDPTRIIPARTLRPGMHSLAAAAPATPHGDPTPIDPKRIIPARTSCPRVPLACGKLPRLSLAMAPSHQGTGYPGMALVCRTIATEHSPLFSPRQAFLLFQGLITQQSTTLLKTPAPPLTQTPCLHDHGTHSAATTPSHRPPTHPGTHCV